jgi:hypothetical protein
MKRFVRSAIGFVPLVGLNWGFIKILIFLYSQWGTAGIWAGFTFLPPIVICPIWQWIETGNYLTFILVYGMGFGGLVLFRLACKWEESN